VTSQLAFYWLHKVGVWYGILIRYTRRKHDTGFSIRPVVFVSLYCIQIIYRYIIKFKKNVMQLHRHTLLSEFKTILMRTVFLWHSNFNFSHFCIIFTVYIKSLTPDVVQYYSAPELVHIFPYPTKNLYIYHMNLVGRKSICFS